MQRGFQLMHKQDILSILTALAATADCDRRTLAIVAQAVGVGPQFARQVQPAAVVFVEQPERLRIKP
jgi:endonuclease V-like protein UPF0215 family